MTAPNEISEPTRAPGSSSRPAAISSGERGEAAATTWWPPGPRPLPGQQFTETASRAYETRTSRSENGSDALSRGIEPAPVRPTHSAVPNVEVRVGNHGDFERVVFEWTEPTDYHWVHRGEQVIVAFSRPGKVDLSRVRDRFGQHVVEARTEGGEVTKRVVLRVLPHARVRSFSLNDDRIVAIDVIGGSAPQQLARPALEVAPPRGQTAAAQLSENGSHARTHGLKETRVQPTGGAARDVNVRVGNHDGFERIVFEWPEAIDYDLVHRAGQVVVTFSRPGRIDFSRVRDRFGQRVLEAWADGGDANRRVVLRVLSDARIRSFSLENDRVVVVDVFGESAPRRPG